MPFVVPTTSVFSYTSDGSASGRSHVDRDGFMSRIGASVFAYPPGGLESAVTAWGFWAGPAPPGTSTLTVLARGFTLVRGYCFALGGWARAWATINATVEEFEPTQRPVEHFFDRPDPDHAEIALPPTARPGAFQLIRTVRGNPIILVNQETSGSESSPSRSTPNATRRGCSCRSRLETSIAVGSDRCSGLNPRWTGTQSRTSHSISGPSFSLSGSRWAKGPREGGLALGGRTFGPAFSRPGLCPGRATGSQAGSEEERAVSGSLGVELYVAGVSGHGHGDRSEQLRLQVVDVERSLLWL